MPPAKMTVRPEMRFGRWTVIRQGPAAKAGHPQWECQCVCGTVRDVRQSEIVSGRSQSCGCLASELSSQRLTAHGMYGTPEYQSWSAMKKRCQNPNDQAYHHYGGRGISVCDKWQTFEGFYEDMGNRPTSDHSLDRVDNDGDYDPSNVRWATTQEQSWNRRTCTMIAFAGMSRSVSEWCHLLGVNYGRTLNRLRRGTSFVDAVTYRKLPTRVRTMPCRKCGEMFTRPIPAQLCLRCAGRNITLNLNTVTPK